MQDLDTARVIKGNDPQLSTQSTFRIHVTYWKCEFSNGTIRAKIKYRTDGRPDGPRAWLMGKTKRAESVPEVTVGR